MKKPLCPVCKEDMVIIMEEDGDTKVPQIFALNELIRKPDGTYTVNQERGLPVVVTLCSNCGCLLQFSAHKMDLTE